MLAIVDGTPPLNALRTFEAAGRLSSITLAAKELCVTPAAVSHQIKALEARLRVRLFTRSHRAIRLTPVGEQYLADVGRHLAGISEATRKIARRRGRKLLNIQAHATFAVRWLIPRLSSFHSANADVDVRITTTLPADDVDGVAIDGAILLGTGEWRGMKAHRLVPNELAPVMSPVLLRSRVHLSRASGLARETLLHALRRPDDWASWLKAAGVTNVDPHSGQKYESGLLAYQAAIEGHGVAMGQKILVEADLKAGRLVSPYEVTLDMGPYTYYFVYRNDAPVSVALGRFRDWLAATATTNCS
jgi:LysR family transcriptional regulator, glycine cleavage system transcriptional activator